MKEGISLSDTRRLCFERIHKQPPGAKVLSVKLIGKFKKFLLSPVAHFAMHSNALLIEANSKTGGRFKGKNQTGKDRSV